MGRQPARSGKKGMAATESGIPGIKASVQGRAVREAARVDGRETARARDPAANHPGDSRSMKSMTPLQPASTGLSGYQKWVVALLAFLQFTLILDFMIISPLGAILMPTLGITPAQFGLVITGVFAGVIGSTVFAITTDLFAYQLRGRVMGIIQTAFAASSVVGIPMGLYLSNRWGWNAPFILIVAISVLVGAVMIRFLRPINAHLALQQDRTPLRHFVHTLSTPRYLQGFATTALLATGGFMLMPYMSAFSVHNLGISLIRLPLVYMITGVCSIIAGPLIGRASDAFGKFLVFCLGCVATIVMVVIYTHLGLTPISLVILINCLLFVGVTSRMISASALISAIPQPADRDSYMSISSSIQQISGGIAAVLGGLIVTETSSGALQHFDTVGYVLVATTLITLVMMYFISRRIAAPATLSSAAA